MTLAAAHLSILIYPEIEMSLIVRWRDSDA